MQFGSCSSAGVADIRSKQLLCAGHVPSGAARQFSARRLFEQASLPSPPMDSYTNILIRFFLVGSRSQEFYKGASISGG
jgi:hypothetical protein